MKKWFIDLTDAVTDIAVAGVLVFGIFFLACFVTMWIPVKVDVMIGLFGIGAIVYATIKLLIREAKEEDSAYYDESEDHEIDR